MNINGDELTPEEIEAYELEGYMNEKAEEFDTLAAERHQAGADLYGPITFLGNDVIRMMLEELADTTNYCRMQAVKLMILQDRLETELGSKLGPMQSDNIEMGFQSFKGTKDVGWKK